MEEPPKSAEYAEPEQTPPADPEPEASDDEEEYETKLSIVYEAAYVGAAEYVSESLEDQLDKEVRDLEDLAGGGDFVTLPENYAEDYKAWRIENCGDGFSKAPAPAAEEPPAQQAPNSPSSTQQSSDTSEDRSSFLSPNPNAGKTEEQLQQELEDAQDTEFRIHGT